MSTCRIAARTIAESHDRTLSVGERVSLRLHLILCSGCRRAARQLRLIRGLVCDATEVPEEEVVPMSAETRERIAGAIARDAASGA